MGKFLAKWELLWILPLAFVVSVFSVKGLETFNSSDASFMLVPIEEIYGSESESYDQVYCASSLVIENFKSENSETKFRSEKSIYDSFQRKGSYVSPSTVCSKASREFLEKWESQGFVYSGIPGVLNEDS